MKIGEVVRLKSGGPRMTVTNTGVPLGKLGDHCWCAWIDSKKEPQSRVYPVEALQRVPDNDINPTFSEDVNTWED